jgi:tetratricopeptide (TPR) repeat protein
LKSNHHFIEIKFMNKPTLITLNIIFTISIIHYNQELYPNPSWKYYFDKGVIEYKAGLYHFAIENLEKSLDKNPELYESANILGDIYLKEDNMKKALIFFEQSLKIKDDQPDIHYKIGDLYYFFLENERAFKHYLNAVSLDQNHIKAHLRLVKFYINLKDKINADKHFYLSYNLGKIKGDKYFQHAIEEEKNRNDIKAIELYQSAISNNPAQIDAYMNISNIYRLKRDYKNAVLYLEKIKEFRPDYEKAYVYLGHLYYVGKFSGRKKRTLHKAIMNLEKAIELNPLNSDTYLLLSEIYRFMGKDVKADEIYRKAIEIK